ncbi:MAG TPA: Gfo/Idh/MocA family oxidoreductase [Candidatus Solibacter sp.]
MLIDRRTILAAPFFVRNLISAPPSGQVRLGAFGAGGMGFVTLDVLARHPKIKIACVAEVDSAKLDQLKAKYPDARVHQDWRIMLAKERKNIDAVCVGTPDHMHAPMAMSAMRLGLPVYQQKPMAHSIDECRRLAAFAHKKNLITQMGIQIHSSKEYRSAVQLVQSGAIGKVKEVHSWSEKKWGDPDPLPTRTDPVPATLNWDAWIGVAQPRPFIADVFHPLNWRKRIDFGTATFGDMGCHILDPVFSALALSAPISVRSEGPAPNKESWALDSVIHYVFPATKFTEGKTVPLTWYDGDARPPQEVQALAGGRKLPGQGSLFIGTKGLMLLPHVGMPVLLPEEQYRGYEMPVLEVVSHYNQFVDAVLGNGKTTAGFDYSGPLTEAVLLGPLATRIPKTTLAWNSAKLKFTNSPEANQYIRTSYRDGWKVKGLD